jgi:regulator of protease activity HflC (stomatin/prohibitin superfamily)
VQVIANQTVVQANASARANVARANGESKAIELITSQLRHDPQYLQWLAVNHWNGQLPYALGGVGGGGGGNGTASGFPFFQLPAQPSQQQLQQQQQMQPFKPPQQQQQTLKQQQQLKNQTKQ